MNKITNIRIKAKSIEDKESILRSLSLVFDIIEESKMYKLDRKNKSGAGYYVYLKVQEKKNIRGAGRKERFSEEDKTLMKMYRLQGKTYRHIASIFNCSVGTAHNIINEDNEEK